MEKIKPLPTFIIRDLATLKVIAEPLHTQIYGALVQEPLTIKQVGERLGIIPTKLYYHFNLMEGAGLIRVVETRSVNSIIEKLYWVIAENLELDPDLLTFKRYELEETPEI